jgi:ParB family chromosome partitioning protein
MNDTTTQDRPVQPTLQVGQIVPGQNYREHYDAKALDELREQVKAAGGIKSPIMVRPHPTQDGLWEIVYGHRRWMVAGEEYGQTYDMPVTIEDLSDAEARALGIIENKGRDNPSAIEEAKGAADLLRYNAGDKEKTANQLGWKLRELDNRLLLLNCAPEVQQAVIERHANISIGHAELLAGLPQDRQVKVLAGILQHKVPVEVLKKQLGQFAKRLSEAIFDTAQCLGCPHNSAQQAALFDASIGEGYCQHPTHYDELTMAALEAKAEPLRERFQVIRFIKPEDGFVPLAVAADGPLGVGAEQMEACKGCASFGCSVSAIPGHYGEVAESLCFDAACNSTKVAARRRAERDAAKPPAAQKDVKGAGGAKPTGMGGAGSAAEPAKPRNQVPGKVVTHRTEFWRKTVANQLMAQGERNQRVLAALVLARETRAVNADRYADVAVKLAGINKPGIGDAPLKKMLEQADAVATDALDALVKAVTASAAYGIDTEGLEALLNYLEVDEARHFTLNDEYLNLLTVSELESLAEEVGLRKAMGERYAKAKAGKRADFIQALLAVEGFAYRGTVPNAMRYPRRKFKYASRTPAAEGATQSPSETGEARREPEASPAA